jgi:hypothetical protein
MNTFLDRLCDQDTDGIRLLLERIRTASLGVWLEEVSAAVTELAYRHPELVESALPDAGPEPERCASTLAEQLATYFSRESPARLKELAALLVRTADGVLQGAVRSTKISPVETRAGLLAAWKGILAGWSSEARS